VSRRRRLPARRPPDRALTELNLLLLLFVAVVPWPTGLLAEYLREPGGESNAAAITYGVVMTAMSGAYGCGSPARQTCCTPRSEPGYAVRSGAGPAAYAASTVIAMFNATTAFVLFAGVAAYLAVSARHRTVEPPPG
jgi:hypothetical protein